MEQSPSEKLRLEGFEALPQVCAPSGVYALCAGGEVLYVGQAKNVYQRITSHWYARRRNRLTVSLEFASPGDIRTKSIKYDRVLVKWVPKEDLNHIERELILRLRPKYNIQIREPLPRIKVDLLAIGLKPEGLRRRRVA